MLSYGSQAESLYLGTFCENNNPSFDLHFISPSSSVMTLWHSEPEHRHESLGQAVHCQRDYGPVWRSGGGKPMDYCCELCRGLQCDHGNEFLDEGGGHGKAGYIFAIFTNSCLFNQSSCWTAADASEETSEHSLQGEQLVSWMTLRL